MDEGITALACRAKTDPDVFAELARRFQPLMKSLAARYWLPDDTEDEVIQVLRIELWNAVKEYRPERPFEGFAKMFLANRVKTVISRKVYSRKHQFFRDVQRLDEWAPDKFLHEAGLSTEDEAIRKWMLLDLNKRLQEALDYTLTDLERECFVRKYVYEQSYRQIQDELGLRSAKAVDNALARVKKKLAGCPVLAELWESVAG